MCEQVDMFNFNTQAKLAAESVAEREQIIRHYARDKRVLFFCHTSAGKDSQAMLIRLRKLVPEEQIICLHADLGERLEHNGVQAHLNATIPANIPLHVVRREEHDLLDTILLRGKWPSAQHRYCTQHHKTAILDSKVRKIMDERGCTVAFNCLGLRADESRQRAQKNPLFYCKRLTGKGTKRVVYDWFPIFELTTEQTFDMIYAARQTPHPAYGERGEKNTRLSCVLCVMANKNDLHLGATNYPETYTTMVAMERVMDHTVFFKTRTKNKQIIARIPVSVAEKAEVPVDEVAVQRAIPVLRARREQLLAQKAEKAAQRKKARVQKAKTGVSSPGKKRCNQTLDMLGETAA